MTRLLALALVVLGTAAGAQAITGVRFAEPTGRYGHHPMGPSVANHAALVLALSDSTERWVRLPHSRVFEDNAARVLDVTGDGLPEVLVVESDLALGARLSVYGAEGLVAASPFIGQRNRWMAVVGAGDLDDDGRIEIAVVDRPHLRRVLQVWRVEGAALVLGAELAGVTNHRFGDPAIRGGLRNCGSGVELVVARGDWSGLLAVRLADGRLVARNLAGEATADGFSRALGCADQPSNS